MATFIKDMMFIYVTLFYKQPSGHYLCGTFVSTTYTLDHLQNSCSFIQLAASKA